MILMILNTPGGMQILLHFKCCLEIFVRICILNFSHIMCRFIHFVSNFRATVSAITFFVLVLMFHPKKKKKWSKFKETGEMSLSAYFTSEPTELTGLFVEKPPENVVAVAGLSQHGQRRMSF